MDKSQTFSVAVALVSFEDSRKLPESAMPEPGLLRAGSIPDFAERLSAFRATIDRFNETGDELLDGVFGSAYPGKGFSFTVVATSGIPDPYDAWTAEFQGERAFFFNLDLWSSDEIAQTALAVVKHELAHLLMEDLLPSPERDDWASQLDEIVIDEGVAHYIGFARGRDQLLSKDYLEKRKEAESELLDAYERLSGGASQEEAEAILKRAQIGPFWDKFGSIAGMFRAAELHSKGGHGALLAAIRAGRLDSKLED